MGTKTVRLDEETEQALVEIRAVTGLSVSAALKRGLLVLREDIAQEASTTPFDVYAALDLGPGGYAQAPARRAKSAVRAVIGRKLGR
ncbi:MAG: hypothetical protein ACR2RL_01930 [Gammaproteobacteria bacterium]